MPPFIEQSLERVKGFWGRSTTSQRILVAGLAVSVVVVFFLLIWWLNQPNYDVLYSKLYPEDASQAVKILQAEKVDYKLQDGGSTILVPSDKVYDLRLKIAGEGKMHGQGVGFEIFDEVQVGQTDFVQHINYQRALQGELSRTIAQFPEVERARVHLVLPEKSLFIEEQNPASASVMLKLKEGEEIGSEKVRAIVNLVALAVEGLGKEQITVADTEGNLIHHPKDSESMEGMTTTQLDYKRRLESDLEYRIEQMLSPLYGAGRVIAKINADLDFSKRTIHKELYDPDSSVVRSEQRSEETQQGTANLNANTPEPNFRGDGIGGSASQQQGSRETRTTNYEINKEEHNIVAQLGEIDRLSVAVIVDGVYTENEAGEEIFTPRNQEELTRIEQLVTNAVGIDQVRGDTIEVSSMSFGGPEEEIPPNVLDIILEYTQRLGKPFLNGLLVFLFLILVVRPVIMALIRPKTEVEGVEGMPGLPEGEGRIALTEGEEGDEEAMDALRKLEDIRAHALQLSESNMDGAMAIIKSWLKEEAA
jgi:flagellar M-ring protein FliF